LAQACGLGERIIVRLEAEAMQGLFRDLDESGALVLELAGGGRRFVTAGDVFFPRA
jgi:BirA family biotin operon repressor/biotin-[acetyl-CoA-carboxylase] ligase